MPPPVATGHTLLEILTLFRIALNTGISSDVLPHISERLIHDEAIRRDRSYDARRLMPDALEQLFTNELQNHRIHISGSASTAITLREARSEANVLLLDHLVERLYAQYLHDLRERHAMEDSTWLRMLREGPRARQANESVQESAAVQAEAEHGHGNAPDGAGAGRQPHQRSMAPPAPAPLEPLVPTIIEPPHLQGQDAAGPEPIAVMRQQLLMNLPGLELLRARLELELLRVRLAAAVGSRREQVPPATDVGLLNPRPGNLQGPANLPPCGRRGSGTYWKPATSPSTPAHEVPKPGYEPLGPHAD